MWTACQPVEHLSIDTLHNHSRSHQFITIEPHPPSISKFSLVETMSPYAQAHVSPKGPGDARPTALQIIKDEKAENTLKGEVIVITGTSSGIGIETTRALAATGATLFLTTRNTAEPQSVLDTRYYHPLSPTKHYSSPATPSVSPLHCSHG